MTTSPAREVERFCAGRWALIPHPAGDLVLGRRSTLVRTRAACTAAGLAVAYVVVALVLGLAVYMLAAPAAVAGMVAAVVAARRSRDRELLARYRPTPGPIYGPPPERYEAVSGPCGPSGVPEPPAPRDRPARAGYGAAWRVQAAIESGRNLPPGRAR